MLGSIEVKIFSRTPNKIKFELNGVPSDKIKLTRDLISSEVPTMAADKLIYKTNTSHLNNEQLALKIGLAPVEADAEEFEYLPPDRTQHEGNTLQFYLKVEASAGKIITVTTNDIIWLPTTKRQVKKFAAHPPRFRPNVELVVLRPGEALELEIYVIKGQGKLHDKWRPGSHINYIFRPRVRIIKPIRSPEAKELKELCPVDVFDIEDLTGKAVVGRERDCISCMACATAFPKSIIVSHYKDKAIFTVETHTTFPGPAAVITKGLELLIAKEEADSEPVGDF